MENHSSSHVVDSGRIKTIVAGGDGVT
jgi:hypothetical protein